MTEVVQNKMKFAPFSYAYCQAIYNEFNEPVDYRFIEVNETFGLLIGIDTKKITGKTINEIFPDIKQNDFKWIENYGRIAQKQSEEIFEQFSKSLSRWFRVYVKAYGAGLFETFITDVTHEHFIAKASKILSQFTFETIDYKLIVSLMREISGASYAILNQYEKDGKHFNTLAFDGIAKNLEKGSAMLGINLNGKKWPYDPIREEKIKGKKITVFKDLIEITGHYFPNSLLSVFEKVFDIGELAVVKTTMEDLMIGDFTLVFNKNKQLKNRLMVETFADLTGLTLSRVEAEKLHSESETKYKIIFENAQDVFYETTLDGIIVELSPSIKTISKGQYTREELIGKSIYLFYQNETEREQLIKTIKEKGSINDFEITLKNRDGELIPCAISAKLYFSEKGEPAKIIGAVRDISDRRKAEEVLRESESKYRNLVETASDGIFLIDENGKIVDTNYSACKVLGYNKNEIIGREINFVDPNFSIEQFLKFWEIGLNEQRIFETSHLRKDGTFIPVEVSGEKFSQNGKTFYYGIARDLTDRKNAEKEIHHAADRFRALIENAPDGVTIVDIDGKYIYASPNAMRHFGYSDDDLNELTGAMLTHPDDLEVVYKAIEEALQKPGGKSNAEYRFKTKSGEYRWIESTFSNLLDFEPVQGIVINFTDITESKKMIAEIISAKEKAEEADRLKSAFLANMSHEIRTPMNGIIGFTTLLAEPGLNDDEKLQYISIIQKSGQRMLNTVNDLIDISKIETGQAVVVKSVTNIKDQLANLFSFFVPEAKEKGLEFILNDRIQSEFAMIETDVAKMDSILTNLIKNAIKYTDKGTITIESKIDNNLFNFSVSDTGIGIPTNRQTAVFNRFEQADIADTRALQGSGLGLTITKAYVEMLGGKIRLESTEGIGTTFYVSIPVLQNVTNQHENHIPVKKEPIESRKLKIVIAEDDEAGFYYLAAILNAVDSEIIHCNDGNEVVTFCRNNPDTDLILMDIRMPGIDGYEATKEIRKFNQKVVIIAQTAFALSGDKEKAISAGCNDYLSKPIKKADLFSAIKKNLEKINTL